MRALSHGRRREGCKGESLARERERLRKAAHASGGAWELEQSNASEHDVVSLAFNVADALVTEGDEIRVVSFK